MIWGVEILLWGGNVALGSGNVALGSVKCSGAAILLWGLFCSGVKLLWGEVALGR